MAQLRTGALAVAHLIAAALAHLSLAAEEDRDVDDASLQDCDLIGDYNFRTRRFDAGTDPAGWYEEDL